MDFKKELAKYGYNDGNVVPVETLVGEVLPKIFKTIVRTKKEREESLLRMLEGMQPDETFKIGTKCLHSGIYRVDNQFIPLSKGERFPPSTISDFWKLVVKL